MRLNFALLGFCVFAATGSAQVAEVSVSGGVSRFGGTALGTLSELASDPKVTISDGFRLGMRLTLNTYRFMGHEFGYAYNRSKVDLPGQGEVPVPIHQGMYNFLLYATPEGSRIRPFGTGGAQFSSFFPPGTSAYYGNQITKFGINYGGGLKVRVTPVWGVRFDVRQYNTGQPFDFFNAKSRLTQTEISAGVAFML